MREPQAVRKHLQIIYIFTRIGEELSKVKNKQSNKDG